MTSEEQASTSTSETAPVPTYLSDVPDAKSFDLVAEQEREVQRGDILKKQEQVVTENLQSLSKDYRTVDFNLDQPLDQSLFDALVEKNYTVSTSYYMSTDHEGKTDRRYHVRVGLPGTSAQTRVPWYGRSTNNDWAWFRPSNRFLLF